MVTEEEVGARRGRHARHARARAAPTSTCRRDDRVTRRSVAARPALDGRRAAARGAAADAGRGARRDGRGRGFDFVLVDCEHGPADLIPLRQHIAAAAAARRAGAGPGRRARPRHDPPGARPGRQGHRRARTSTPPTTRARAGRVGALSAARHAAASPPTAVPDGSACVDPAAHRDWFLANTLVLGMIESPAGVAAAADDRRHARPRRHHDRHRRPRAPPGPRPIRRSPTLVARVNAVLAAAGTLRMDIVRPRHGRRPLSPTAPSWSSTTWPTP